MTEIQSYSHYSQSSDPTMMAGQRHPPSSLSLEDQSERMRKAAQSSVLRACGHPAFKLFNKALNAYANESFKFCLMVRHFLVYKDYCICIDEQMFSTSTGHLHKGVTAQWVNCKGLSSAA